ncbi:MAG: ABC transporter substrate-binding protein [Acidisphaera sp.]|nr:ABC transporter substrate-binding protein [Acidisphaera sp.]
MVASGRAWAQAGTVRIGAAYPLSGAVASAGKEVKQAVEVAAEIVNNAHPELSAIPLAAGAGLPNLGGRKVEVVFADHQGNPATAQSETLRLITQEHVIAMLGSYQSNCTLTSSAVSERYGIPFVAGESSAPSLTQRGYKWFFRTTPIGTDFGKAYGEFLQFAHQKGQAIEHVAIVNENTEYGTSTGDAIIQGVQQHGFKVGPRVVYSANAADLSSEVLQLKQAQPDAAIFVSYTADSILYLKTMHSLDYRPAVVIGDDSGFSDPAFIQAVGDVAQGAVNRSSWDRGKPGSTTEKVNTLYKAHTGRDMDDTSARAMQGALSLFDAINRAGTTEPAKIQAALRATDTKAEQLMIGYNGVKFDANGQNALASTLIVQLKGRDYVAVWPAASATADLQVPFKGWS